VIEREELLGSSADGVPRISRPSGAAAGNNTNRRSRYFGFFHVLRTNEA
jgi:hypothetical protein